MKKITFLLVLLFFNQTFSQNQYKEKELQKVFQNYTKSYQEIVFTHLNKNKLIQGEALGFTAYVLNKHTKKPSPLTKNLYCVIEDENKKIIAKKLYKVENGIANGIFRIDDVFKNGNYTFKAYTNWMLNFTDQQNYYSSTFQVLDVTLDIDISKIERSKNLDIQMLPESGHYLSGINNTIGVIVKDSLGYGVPNLKGEILNKENKKVSSFTLNNLGISRYTFKPDINEQYKLIIKQKNGMSLKKDFIPNIKIKGLLLKVVNNNKHCILSIETNKETLPSIIGKKYKLTLHDGKILKEIDISFTNQSKIIKKIPLSALATGVNIFTIFNDANTPIAERLFFNYNNLNILKSKVTLQQKKDTATSINLKYEKFNNEKFNNVSISILPVNTKSYIKNSNIIAQTFLKPYIKGSIENSGYYFKNINKKTKYDLDNLLITQGWSSYNWGNIFNYIDLKGYSFENGISLKINIPKNEKATSFFLHNTSQTNPDLINLKKGSRTIIYNNFYPKNKEPIYISKIDKKGEASTVGLYIQYFPRAVPALRKKLNNLKLKKEYFTVEEETEEFSFLELNRDQVLDEVVLNFDLEEVRRNSIRKKSRGKVYFIEENDRKLTLANYLNLEPDVVAFDNMVLGTISVINRVSGLSPAYVLDGVLVDEKQLFYFLLEYIDYIDFDYYDYSYSDTLLDFGGVLKVVTHPDRYKQSIKQFNSKFEVPLGFTKDKKFYKPLYPTYKDNFFKEYGVIDWLPINKIDENGSLSISFWNNQPNDIKLFIEGVTEDGDFIFEEKTIKIKTQK